MHANGTAESRPCRGGRLQEANFSFTCRRCGACCRIADGICRVSAAEIVAIARYLGRDEADFIAHETELAPDRKSLMLTNRPDGACSYLTEDNRCRIYPVRPEKCRTFPQAWVNANSREYCPGLQAEKSDDVN